MAILQGYILTEVNLMTERIPIVEDTATSAAASESRAVFEPKNFDDLLLTAVDEAMMRLFNETATKSIYTYLKNINKLKLEDFGAKPDIFSTSLHNLLGSGALVIENVILRILCQKLNLEFTEKEGYTFPDYIKKLRKTYESC